MHSFPFFGAGAANYFEWAEVMVRFSRAPTVARKRALLSNLPKPLVDAKWNGRTLSVSSGQKINPKKVVFNTAIDEWLMSLHQSEPIVAVFRRQDFEAGGTTLSSWHVESLKSLRVVWDDLCLDDDELTLHMLRGILEYAKAANKKLTAAQHQVLNPSKQLREALKAGDATCARKLLDGDDRNKLLDYIDAEAILEDLKMAPIAFALLDIFLDPDSPLLYATVRLSLRAPKDSLFKAILRAAPKNAAIGNALADNAIGSAAGKQFVERALAGLDQVIAKKQLTPHAFSLALHAINPRQSRLPLDAKRTRRYLAVSLPFAKKEPWINFFAACLFAELGEPASALTQLETALTNGFDDLQMIRTEPAFASLRKELRFKMLRS